MVLANRGYDADWIRAFINQQGAWANIPPKVNRKDPICFSPHLFRARNLVERFFNKIKQCRRIATRYDKLAANYLAFIKLASIRLWLRTYESTPRRLRRPWRGATGVLGYSTTPSPGSPSRNERRVAGEAFRSCSLASAPEAIASSVQARAALANDRRQGSAQNRCRFPPSCRGPNFLPHQRQVQVG
jgi:Transposase and inactivated derivatives